MTAVRSRFAAQPRWVRRTVRAGLWTLGIVLVLAGSAALLLPGVLKDLAIAQIRDQLHRDATIGSVAFNPLRLSLTVRSLAIADRDGANALLAFDELHTRIGVTSLFRLAPVVAELELKRPQVRLVRFADERYNITDIVERLLAGPPNPAGPRFALNSLSISDGEVVFDDRPSGKVHRIEQLQLKLPTLSGFEADRNEFAQPSLSAMINGDPFELAGRTKPFAETLETTVHVRLADVDVPSYLGYSPVALPIRIEHGTLGVDLDVDVARGKDQAWSVRVKGGARLDDFEVRDPAASGSAAPLVAVKRIGVELGELKWPQDAVRIDRVLIEAPQLAVRREKDGTLDWQNLFAPRTPPSATGLTPAAMPVAPTTRAPAPTGDAGASVAPIVAPATGTQPVAGAGGWQWSLADLEVRDGRLVFEDLATNGPPFRALAPAIAIRATNLGSAAGTEAKLTASIATDAGEKLTHEGTLTLSPLAAEGNVALTGARLARYQPYITGFLAGSLDGMLDAAGRYTLQKGKLALSDGRVGVADVVVKDVGRSEVARIAALSIEGIAADADKRTLAIAAIGVRQCRLALARDASGKLNLSSLVRTAAAPAPSAAAAKVDGFVTAAMTTAAVGGALPAAQPAPWSASVGRTSIERCVVQVDDASTVSTAGVPARILLDPLDLRIDEWALAPDNRAKLQLAALVNKKGRIGLKGTAGGAPLRAELDVAIDGLDLVAFQPYVADRLNVRLKSGALSTAGRLSFDAGPPSVRYRGDAGVARFATTTNADGEDFLNWDALQARRLDVAVDASPSPSSGKAVTPLALMLDEVALSGFYSRLIVNADGTLNVQHVVRAAGADRTESAAAAAGVATLDTSGAATNTATADAAKGNTAPATAADTGKASPSGSAPAGGAGSPASPITIRQVTLASGRVNFSDRFIRPNYSADVFDVDGTIKGLSSDPVARANVEVRGRYEPSAPVEIKGSINPLSGNLFVDIAASCRDVELVQFSPYAQKYAGYGITKGKLALSVKYLIEDRKLTAENNLLLEQLTFGDKVESPDATKLPVLFAVSLLKNANGEIDLNLPISGSLDDPQFSVFAIVLKIVGNLLVKAATSPFALLGALAGGGEDLAYVDYAPGIATVSSPDQQEKLAKVAKALTDRPSLKLDIAGRVDPAADAEALKRAALMRKLAAQREGDAEVPTTPEAITIPPGEFAALLKRAFDNETKTRPTPTGQGAGGPVAAAATGAAASTTSPLGPQGQQGATPAGGASAVAAPSAVAADPSQAEMERVLLSRIDVTQDVLGELAEQRANAAKTALSRLGVPSERMFIVAAGAARAQGDRRTAPGVDFVLK